MSEESLTSSLNVSDFSIHRSRMELRRLAFIADSTMFNRKCCHYDILL